MRRFLICALGLVVVATALPVRAKGLKTVVTRVRRDFHRNNMWPKPFVQPDREYARAPFGMMIANGWRLQNTLGDHHFDADTSQLNEAGSLRVRGILTETPPEHRTVFVLRGHNAEDTQARLQSVHEASVGILPDGETPEVAETSVRPSGWPAEYIDNIGRKFHASTPSPRIPARESSSESSGG